MNAQFSTNFRQWIEDNRWTPTTLAAHLGVQRQSIHNWIDGKSFPKNETILQKLVELDGKLIKFNQETHPFKHLLKAQKMNEHFEIEGGHQLHGKIRIPGAKNAALPMLCAALLTPETCHFSDVPNITDIRLLLDIFETLGAKVSRNLTEGKVSITAKDINPEKLKDCQQAKKFRASILIVGPLLARFGKAEIAKPGGCIIGARPNDVHLNGFEAFGANVSDEAEKIIINFDGKFKNSTVSKLNLNQENQIETTEIHPQVLLPEASVTATENLATFAAGVPEKSEIFFTAMETHVTATIKMLAQMGAKIDGIGTHHLTITGKSSEDLKGGHFTIPADGLLAATYAIAGILTKGDIWIENVNHYELLSFYGVLKRTGANFEFFDNTLHVFGEQNLKAIPKLQTAIFPGVSTDLQSPFGVLLTQCQGSSLVFETLFENRLTYLSELEKMGAKISILNAHQAHITGKTQLHGTSVQSWDLRAGAAMVLAGLIAKGTTKVTNINYIDRGYENFEENLRSLGAKITRKN